MGSGEGREVAIEEGEEFEVNPDTTVVRVKVMVEGFSSTVGCVGCDLCGHEDVVKALGSASICGNFVVEAEFTGTDVDETKVGCKLVSRIVAGSRMRDGSWFGRLRIWAVMSQWVRIWERSC